jgi:hypothetical protein
MNEEPKECYICLDTIIEIRKQLFCGCNNNYHDDCLTKWLVNNNNKCPICGIIIDIYEITENNDLVNDNIPNVAVVVIPEPPIQPIIIINNNLVYNKYVQLIALIINGILMIFGIIYFKK